MSASSTNTARGAVAAEVSNHGRSATVRAGTLTLARSKHAQRFGRAAAGLSQDEQHELTGVSLSLIKAQESRDTTKVMNLSHLLAQPSAAFEATLRELCKAREELYGERPRRLLTVTPAAAALEVRFSKLLNDAESLRHQAAEIAGMSGHIGVLSDARKVER